MIQFQNQYGNFSLDVGKRVIIEVGVIPSANDNKPLLITKIENYQGTDYPYAKMIGEDGLETESAISVEIIKEVL